MTVRIAASLAIVVSVLATEAEVHAGDDTHDASVAFYEQREAPVASYAAKALWRAAKAARDDDLHAQCVRLSERILDWNPDHAGARAHLGFVRKKSGWTLDADASAAVVRATDLRSGDTHDKYLARIAEWNRRWLHPASLAVGKRFARLGRDCAKKGYEQQAQRAYRNALAFDAEQAAAHAATGHEKRSGYWLETELAPAFAERSGVTAAEPAKAWEGALGRSLPGARTQHVQVVETEPLGWAESASRAGELASIIVLDFLGRDAGASPLGDRAIQFAVVDDEHWGAWVNAFPQKGVTIESRAWGGRSRAAYAFRREWWQESRALDDWVAHCVAEVILDRLWKKRRSDWLWEGTSQHVAASVVANSDVRCSARPPRHYASTTETERMFGSQRWRRLVRRLVESGDELPMRTLMSRSVADMSLEDGVQAWSVVTWLRSRNRDAFVQFVNAAHVGADQAKLAVEMLGGDPETLHEAWSAYVVRMY